MGRVAASEAATSSTRLRDWYATDVAVHRRHVVLAVSGVTLLPVLVEAAPYKTMTSRFVEATGELLRALGVSNAHVVAEVGSMRDRVVAPTNDRRVLGSMNDFMRLMEAYDEDHSVAGGRVEVGGGTVQSARNEEPPAKLPWRSSRCRSSAS